LIHEGENGYLVDVGDSNRLAESINHLLSNAALRRKMGRFNRKMVKEKYDVQAVVHLLSRQYEAILTKKELTPSYNN